MCVCAYVGVTVSGCQWIVKLACVRKDFLSSVLRLLLFYVKALYNIFRSFGSVLFPDNLILGVFLCA